MDGPAVPQGDPDPAFLVDREPAVGIPRTLTLDDLRAMPSVERVVTMECAGNGRLGQTPMPVGEPWGSYAVSTARWTGAFLHQVLEQAGPTADSVDVKFEGADHGPYYQFEDIAFNRSLAFAHAADPAAEILIAYELNGEPLSADHGAPFRLIVPHWYGVASVKWLRRIQVLTEPYVGEFQVGHYMYEWADRPHEPVTLLRVRARITDPAPRATISAGIYTVRGNQATPATGVSSSCAAGAVCWWRDCSGMLLIPAVVQIPPGSGAAP